MKQVIGIYTGNFGIPYTENSINEGALGGSETWAIEISKRFQNLGYHVIIFGRNPIWHFADSGVEYVPYFLMEERCQYQHFDYFIFSRVINDDITCINCKHIYMMAHDMSLYIHEIPDEIESVVYLSDFQKGHIQWQYSLTPDSDWRFKKIFNGITQDLYQDVDNYTKKNKMIWSSDPNRGLLFFLDNIYPKIKFAVPDFEVQVCSYITLEDKYLRDGVSFLYGLNKEELSRAQKEAKIWIYPNIGRNENGSNFQETFCITAVENAMSKNALVCVDAGGLKTTLDGCHCLLCGDKVLGNHTCREEDWNDIANAIAEESIRLLTDEEYRLKNVSEVYEKCKDYTWDNVVQEWIKIFKNGEE